MTLTLAQGIALMKSAAAETTRNGASWHNWCARYVCAFVTGLTADGYAVGNSAETARQALAASGPLLSADGSKAVPGVIGWWSNGTTGDGHVAVYVGGGKWAMASDAVDHGGDGSVWGKAQGTISLTRYAQLKPAMKWVGFTADYVGQIFSDKKILLKVPGSAPIYRIVSAGTIHWLTPEEYAPLRDAGTPVLEVPASIIGRFKQV